MAHQFVIWTRYQKPGNKQVVRHVYGPYPTRGKALTVVKHMKKNHIEWYGNFVGCEISIVKLITEEMMTCDNS